MKKLIMLTLATFYFSLFTPIEAQTISTIAGNGVAGFSGDGGQATDAEIWSPSGMFVDKIGNVYISDGLNNRIRKINTSGIITSIAGNGFNPGGHGGYSGDGGPATEAELYNPQSICTDILGNVYVADFENNRVRKVDTNGIISTIAGNGNAGFSGDGGAATACEFKDPASICFDTSGNLYIADPGNYRIRKVNTLGIITTVAGGGISLTVTNGVPATSVRLGEIYGVFINDSGNIYISYTNQGQVYKVDRSGNIYIVAGNGVIGFSGDGGPATDAEMYQSIICLDASDNLYISDTPNNRVREVNHNSEIINTIVGNGIIGYSGDGGTATDAELNSPDGIFIDGYNNLYVSDYYNYRVRKITNITGISSVNHPTDFTIFPNPTNQVLTIKLNRQINGLATLWDITGRELYNEQLRIDNEQLQIDVSVLPPGMYFLGVKTNDTFVTQKFIKQ